MILAYRRCVARPRLHSEDDVLAAAARVFRQQGVATTTAQIAVEAGVSNGTLFNFYPTKQELIDALHIWLMKELSEAIGAIGSTLSHRSQLRVVWKRWLLWAKENPGRHAVIHLLCNAKLVTNGAQVAANQFLGAPALVLDQVIASGRLVDLPNRYLVDHMQQQITHAATAELDDAAVELAFDVWWTGIQK